MESINNTRLETPRKRPTSIVDYQEFIDFALVIESEDDFAEFLSQINMLCAYLEVQFDSTERQVDIQQDAIENQAREISNQLRELLESVEEQGENPGISVEEIQRISTMRPIQVSSSRVVPNHESICLLILETLLPSENLKTRHSNTTTTSSNSDSSLTVSDTTTTTTTLPNDTDTTAKTHEFNVKHPFNNNNNNNDKKQPTTIPISKVRCIRQTAQRLAKMQYRIEVVEAKITLIQQRTDYYRQTYARIRSRMHRGDSGILLI